MKFKQFIMANEFKEYADRLRFFIGDVRDKERMMRALRVWIMSFMLQP